MSYWPYICKVLRPQRRRLVWSIVAMLGITLLDLAAPLVVACLIDTVVAGNRYDLLAPLMIGFALLPLAAAVCRFANSYLVALVSQRVVFDIRLALYRRVQQLSCRFLHATPVGKIMERLRGDIQQLQALLSAQTPQLAVRVLTGLFMVVVMFFLSFRLTLLVLAAVWLYVANYKWFVRRIRMVQRGFRRKMDRLSSLAQERLDAAAVVKTYGSGRSESRAFLRRNFLAEREFHRYRLLCVSYGVVSRAITWGSYGLIILVGALMAAYGQVTYGAVTAVTAFSFRLLAPAAELADLSNQIQLARVALDRIFELMRGEGDMIERTGRKPGRLTGGVRFENVSFRYEPGKPVLEDFTLEVKPGQTVAFVGATGCGKTTLVNLLYRYYDVDRGAVKVDGHDIRELDTAWYRRQLALVPQEPIVFEATLAENIAYGRHGASLEEIARAARLAELGELIDRLPEGLATPVGPWGAKLSVGEKQRICVARAVLADPVVLIFDEATSSLDTRREAKIQVAMRRVMARRTCLVIAHRLSTIVSADVIVVMDAGRIVEMGSHARLMAQPEGRYRRLFLTQAAATSWAGAV